MSAEYIAFRDAHRQDRAFAHRVVKIGIQVLNLLKTQQK